MRSTKYDKKGSMSEDMLKHLKDKLFDEISSVVETERLRIAKKNENPYLDKPETEPLSVGDVCKLNNIVPVVAETIVLVCLFHDTTLLEEQMLCPGSPGSSAFIFSFSNNLSLAIYVDGHMQGKWGQSCPIFLCPEWLLVVQGLKSPKEFVERLV